MLFAIDDAKNAVSPVKGATALCPDCGQIVRAKCGSVNTAHWAHLPRTDWDSFAEGETAWHRGWKAMVQAKQQEVVLVKDGQTHRADLVGEYGVVVELQHSPISPAEAEKREEFYGEMIWVFDAAPFWSQLSFLSTHHFGRWPHLCLNWKRERPSIVTRRRTTYLDVGNHLLYRLHVDYGKRIGLYGQQGTFIAKSEFLNEIFGNFLSSEGLKYVNEAHEFQPPNR